MSIVIPASANAIFGYLQFPADIASSSCRHDYLSYSDAMSASIFMLYIRGHDDKRLDFEFQLIYLACFIDALTCSLLYIGHTALSISRCALGGYHFRLRK